MTFLSLHGAFFLIRITKVSELNKFLIATAFTEVLTIKMYLFWPLKVCTDWVILCCHAHNVLDKILNSHILNMSITVVNLNASQIKN